MRQRDLIPVLAVILAACGKPAPAYLGTWTPDMSSIDVSKVTLTYAPRDGGGFMATMDGQTFAVPVDGSDAESPWGGTMATTQVDAHTWVSVDKLNGGVVGTDTLALAADGQSLEMRSHRKGADGADMPSTMQFKRTAGDSTLVGTWEAGALRGMTGDMTFSAAGSDSLTLDYTTLQTKCTTQMGGSDAAVTSAMMGDGWTCATSQNADGSLAVTWKRNGEKRYASVYSVSGDTLTEVTTAEGTSQPVTMKYTKKAGM